MAPETSLSLKLILMVLWFSIIYCGSAITCDINASVGSNIGIVAGFLGRFHEARKGLEYIGPSIFFLTLTLLTVILLGLLFVITAIIVDGARIESSAM